MMTIEEYQKMWKGSFGIGGDSPPTWEQFLADVVEARDKEIETLKELVLDKLYFNVVVDNIGIYPKSVKGGKNPYKKRTDFMEGHNKCAMQITKDVITISDYVKKHKHKDLIKNALLKEYISVSIDDKEVKFFVNCNDVFYWGCSDAEDIEPEEIPDLLECYKQTNDYGDMLWCCRKRKMRPQKPWFGNFCNVEKQLFESCGEERDE